MIKSGILTSFHRHPAPSPCCWAEDAEDEEQWRHTGMHHRRCCHQRSCSAMSDQTQDTAFSQNVASYIAYRLGVGCVVNPFTVKLQYRQPQIDRHSVPVNSVLQKLAKLTSEKCQMFGYKHLKHVGSTFIHFNANQQIGGDSWAWLRRIVFSQSSVDPIAMAS